MSQNNKEECPLGPGWTEIPVPQDPPGASVEEQLSLSPEILRNRETFSSFLGTDVVGLHESLMKQQEIIESSCRRAVLQFEELRKVASAAFQSDVKKIGVQFAMDQAVVQFKVSQVKHATNVFRAFREIAPLVDTLAQKDFAHVQIVLLISLATTMKISFVDFVKFCKEVDESVMGTSLKHLNILRNRVEAEGQQMLEKFDVILAEVRSALKSDYKNFIERWYDVYRKYLPNEPVVTPSHLALLEKFVL